MRKDALAPRSDDTSQLCSPRLVFWTAAMLLAGLSLRSIDFESAEIRVETREEEDGINEVMKSQREAVKAEQQINSDNKKIIENLHSQLEKAQLEVSIQGPTTLPKLSAFEPAFKGI